MKENLDDIEVTDDEVAMASLLMECYGGNETNNDIISLFSMMIASDNINPTIKPMLHDGINDALLMKDPAYIAKSAKKLAKERKEERNDE